LEPNSPIVKYKQFASMGSRDRYNVKKDIVFTVPSRDVTNQTPPGRESLNYSRLGRVWFVTSRLGTGKTVTFFTVSYDKMRCQDLRFQLLLYAIFRQYWLTKNRQHLFESSTVGSDKAVGVYKTGR
jgi:hypothetical protein